MKSIILSLISLFSVTCYGAVDLEALKLKAAAYAQKATPALGIMTQKVSNDHSICTVAKRQFLTHITPLDSEYNYFYHKSSDDNDTQESNFIAIMVTQEGKAEFRKALAQNVHEAIIKSMQASFLPATREYEESSTIKRYLNTFKKWLGFNTHSFKPNTLYNHLSPLHIALITGQYDIAIDLIITHKADLNFIAENGITPLMCVIDKPQHHFMPELLMFMIEQGANPEIGCIKGEKTYSAASVAESVYNAKALQLLEEEYGCPDKITPSLLEAENAPKEIVTFDGQILLMNDEESALGLFSADKKQLLCIPRKSIPMHDELPLLQATYSNDLKLLAYLLKKCKNLSDFDKGFACLYATQTSNTPLQELFKEHGFIAANEILNTIPLEGKIEGAGPYILNICEQS